MPHPSKTAKKAPMANIPDPLLNNELNILAITLKIDIKLNIKNDSPTLEDFWLSPPTLLRIFGLISLLCKA